MTYQARDEYLSRIDAELRRVSNSGSANSFGLGIVCVIPAEPCVTARFLAEERAWL
jgi:hypothetical protein